VSFFDDPGSSGLCRVHERRPDQQKDSGSSEVLGLGQGKGDGSVRRTWRLPSRPGTIRWGIGNPSITYVGFSGFGSLARSSAFIGGAVKSDANLLVRAFYGLNLVTWKLTLRTPGGSSERSAFP
jgi:hypothetical protein